MQIERVNGKDVRVAIESPADVNILRSELVEREKRAAKLEAQG